MSNLIFLLGAIGLSIVGSVLLWLRYRKPTTFMSSISDFQREMDALGREPTRAEVRRYRRRAGKTRPDPIVPPQHDDGLAEQLRSARRGSIGPRGRA